MTDAREQEFMRIFKELTEAIKGYASFVSANNDSGAQKISAEVEKFRVSAEECLKAIKEANEKIANKESTPTPASPTPTQPRRASNGPSVVVHVDNSDYISYWG